MDQATHNKTVSFIRGIADDVLCDLFKRGKYEISFYKPQMLRSLEDLRADILGLEKETEGLLEQIVQGNRA